MKKNYSLIAMVIVTLAMSLGVSNAYAQATQGLCISSYDYSIDPATASSTYAWGIDNGTSGTDWELTVTDGTATGDKATVNWLKEGTYDFWSQETSEFGCVGPKGYVTVTVSAKPKTPNLDNSICSVSQGGSTVDKVTLTLAPGFEKYVFKGIVIPSGVTAESGNASLTVGQEINGTSELGIIANDAYTNVTSAPADVVYTFAPYSATCEGVEGDEFTVTIKVYPQVKAPTIKF